MQYLWIFATVFMAFSTGRSILFWAAASYFVGWVALIAIIFLPVKQEKLEKRAAFIHEWAEEKLAKEQMGKYETVDDLFKQLETK